MKSNRRTTVDCEIARTLIRARHHPLVPVSRQRRNSAHRRNEITYKIPYKRPCGSVNSGANCRGKSFTMTDTQPLSPGSDKGFEARQTS
jgi:hypothetical protein